MDQPKTTRCLVLQESQTAQKDAPVYHDVVMVENEVPALKEGEILVRISAVAFNHRDIWIRRNMYPSVSLGAVMGSDASGVVVSSTDGSDTLIGKRVFLVPMRGWEEDPRGPEQKFGIIGGTAYPVKGVFSDFVVVERDQVIEIPDHMDDVHAAAWPLAGVTAWRAVIVKGEIQKGHHVLITGIGGGVALVALQLCVALGANVWVTSGNEDKIQKAMSLGAKGGVIYKHEKWGVQLGELMKKTDPSAKLDAVIDSAGGEICAQTSKIVRDGARIVVFGMTATPKVSFTMREVLKSVELKGSTMGSHRDLINATEFIAKHSILPVVSDVIVGLDKYAEGFDLMKSGGQVGKIVIKVSDEGKGKL
ncbi:NADP-binding protein [Dacryopinax primogenitus]|uniref:NADP-binding protein n=1 Tax=Dacryopinax primogenitus (strain DJM 731) TaxID=1858805 RepID=M5GFC9_DACPD|nr:NADP-binding protein [Dacryopinax primogenitus]EJU04048.1 NADP-binding protein [Dacryopinax primogenitus]